MRIVVASLLLVACSTTNRRPLPVTPTETLRFDCEQICERPDDVSSCHTECKQRVERHAPLLCGTPYLQERAVRSFAVPDLVIASVVLGGIAAVFGGVTYVTLDYLSYAR